MVASNQTRPNHWKSIVGDVKSTTAISEQMVLMTGIATAQAVGDGANVSFDTVTAPYDKRFATQIYAIGVEFTEKQLKTDQSGKLRRIGEEFGKSLYYQKEVMVADIINNGTSTTGIDGKALFVTDHPSSGGTWSNLSTAASLDATSLKQLLIDRKSHKTLKGQPWLDLGPVNIVIADELEFVAEILIKSDREAGVADNDMNPMPRIARFTMGNPFLTDTNAFTAVPIGKDNPIFLLEGNLDRPIREDDKPERLSKIMVAAQDHTTGWLYPAGVQHNAGL
jgi:phage major head subunit gpT-like protein